MKPRVAEKLVVATRLGETHTSRLEDVNNKIKGIKPRAYGFDGNRYFMLKVKQAFDIKGINQFVQEPNLT